MIVFFSFNTQLIIKTLDSFQTGNNKSSANSSNDLTAVNTRNAISAVASPTITATYRPIKNIVNYTVIQSPHNYPNNANLTYTVNKPGALSISLFFVNISVESCCDYVNVYNKNWILEDTFHSGQNYYNQNVTINSDTVYVVLTSDFSVTYYGFYISSETYQIQEPVQSSYYQNYMSAYNIIYSINDASPTTYDLYQNNNLVSSSSYVSNQPFSFVFTNLNLYTNNFTLIAFDSSGSNSSVQNVFQILPIPIPTFTKIPKSLVLTESNNTGTISWAVQGQNSTYYKVLINGIEAAKGNYNSNETITYTINLDNPYLNNGTNSLEIVAYNALTGSAREEINVTIFESYTPIVLSSTSTISRSIVQAQHPSRATPYSFFASILGLLFSIILIKRRRKQLN